MVSRSIGDWVIHKQIVLENLTPSTQVGILSIKLVEDAKGDVVLATDTNQWEPLRIWDDKLDTIALSWHKKSNLFYDTLNFGDSFTFDIFSKLYDLKMDSSSYINYSSKGFRFNAGQYTLTVYLNDTSLSTIIDSTESTIILEDKDMPVLNHPNCYGIIPNEVHSSIPFFIDYPDSSLYYRFQLVGLTENDILENNITSKFKNTLNLLIDKPIFYNQILTLGSIAPTVNLSNNIWYAWTVKAYLDTHFTMEIAENNGYADPFLFKLTDDNSSDTALLYKTNFLCDGGPFDGFESGITSLNGWICETGTREKGNGRSKMTLIGQNNNRHRVVNKYYDFQTDLMSVPVNGGNFALKLGNLNSNAEAERITKIFMVTPQNQILFVRFALALANAHSSDVAAFFKIRVTRRGKLFPIRNILYDGATDGDKSFREYNGLFIKDWDCIRIDLTKFVGQTVRVEITTSDCDLGGHAGMAFVDFCGNPSPNIKMNINQQYCLEDDIILDASESEGLKDWQITIEECADIQGTRMGSKEVFSNWFQGKSEMNNINIKAIYNSNGLNFECNKYYRVKIGGTNTCTNWVEKVKVIYIDCPIANAGPDRCDLSGLGGFQLGSAASIGNTYLWDPSSCLSDATSSQPAFIGPCILDYPIEYKLTVTNSNQCTAIDYVKIFNQAPTDIIITKSISADVCKEVTLNFEVIGGSYLSWSYTDLNGKLSSGSGNELTIIPSNDNDIIIDLVAQNACGTFNKQYTIPKNSNSYYYQPIPTIIYANTLRYGKHSLEVFEFGEERNEQPAYHATWYKMEVWNNWGEKIALIEGEGGNFFNGEILWDGKANGKYVQADVYHWTIQMGNCATKVNSTQIMRRRWVCLEYKWEWKPLRHWTLKKVKVCDRYGPKTERIEEGGGAEWVQVVK